MSTLSSSPRPFPHGGSSTTSTSRLSNRILITVVLLSSSVQVQQSVQQVHAISFFVETPEFYKPVVNFYSHHDSKGNYKQPVVYHLDNKMCNGLEYDANITDIRHCEWACYIDTECEAWQYRNFSKWLNDTQSRAGCYRGKPVAKNHAECDGVTEYFVCPHEQELLEEEEAQKSSVAGGAGNANNATTTEKEAEERSSYCAACGCKDGSKPFPMFADSHGRVLQRQWDKRQREMKLQERQQNSTLVVKERTGSSEGNYANNKFALHIKATQEDADAAQRCASVKRHFNNQVLGARIRWVTSLEHDPSSLSNKYAMRFHAYTGLMGGVCQRDDGSFCEASKQVSELTHRKNRFRYRIGTSMDEGTMWLCRDSEEQREKVEKTQYGWEHEEDMGDKALLKLRAAIPREHRTGRFLNFGIGTGDHQDPLFYLFRNRRLDRTRKERDRQRRERYGESLPMGQDLRYLEADFNSLHHQKSTTTATTKSSATSSSTRGGARVVEESTSTISASDSDIKKARSSAQPSSSSLFPTLNVEDIRNLLLQHQARADSDHVDDINHSWLSDSELQRVAAHLEFLKAQKIDVNSIRIVADVDEAGSVVAARVLHADVNEPEWIGFGFELYRSIAEKVEFERTNMIIGSVTPDNLYQLLAKTGFFPTLLMDDATTAHLRKHIGTDAKMLARMKEFESGEINEFHSYPHAELETVKLQIESYRTTPDAPSLVNNMQDVEDVLSAAGGREFLWERERRYAAREHLATWAAFGQAGRAIIGAQAGGGATAPHPHDVAPSRGGTSSIDLEPDPTAIELVIIDIDSYDYNILDLIAQTQETVLIYRLEVQQHIPPPYKYAFLYHPEKNPLYKKHMRYDEDMYFNPVYGQSLSAALDRLKETHHLLYLTGLTDAIFVHKKLTPFVEAAFGVTLPVDEFQCWRQSCLWHQYDQIYVRSWAFNEEIYEGLRHIHDNMTMMSPVPEEEGNTPFLLWV